MPITALNLVNLRTTGFSMIENWYTTVLGLTRGRRPDFPFPGVWLYAGDTAVVHLVGIEGEPATGSKSDLKLEHVALCATDAKALGATLQATGTRFDRATVEAARIALYNLCVPDRNPVHVDCPIDV